MADTRVIRELSSEKFSVTDMPSMFLFQEVLERTPSAVVSDDWTTSDKAVPASAPFVEVHRTSQRENLTVAGYWRQVPVRLVFQLRSGSIGVAVVHSTESQAREIVTDIRRHIPYTDPTIEQRIWVTFWYNTRNGPGYNARKLDVPVWNEINFNYPRVVRAQLDLIMNWTRPPGGGKLMLLHGIPGSGKTFFIRALGWSFRKWLRIHYISDPEAMLAHGEYIMRVLSEGADIDDVAETEYFTPEHMWRLLVLEDTGELLTRDAKVNTGQGLSRLLNVVDGLLGQGRKTLVLITTNEDIGAMHPAVIRPGRCLAKIHFPRFEADEAQHWLEQHGVLGDGQAATLAELYAKVEGRGVIEESKVGFGRR